MITTDPRPYFDPRDGSEITADEFVRRYSVNAFLWVERPDRAPEPATASAPAGTPGLPSFGARCRGCGTGVVEPGALCPMCAMKPHFAAPKASLVLDAQPRPAYLTPDTPTED